MNGNKQYLGLFVAVVAVTIAGCGGGGGGSTPVLAPPPPPPPPPAASAAAAFGTVTAIDSTSITVNGVSYDTSGATFTIDGAAGAQADLGLGDVVLVRGSVDPAGNTGTADTVAFDDVVDGIIFGIDRTGGLITVLQQNVKVNAETTFGGSVPTGSLDGLSAGDIVEVSGFEKANGDIAATRVELKSSAGELEVTGTVSNLDSANSRFNINNLVVDFSAAQLRDFDSGSIAEGDRVEAKGDNRGPNGELLATSVEFKGGVISGDSGDRLEVEGFISRFVSPTDFDVATQAVTTDGQTVFTGGVAADLGLNVKVEVEGTLDANDVLVATKVDIRRAKVVRITADVDSVDAPNNRIVVLGIDIEVDELTRIEDKSSADVEPLTLGLISAGNYVEIRGSEDPGSSADVVAAIVEREDQDNDAILQGFVESVAEPTLTILGVTIETSGAIFRDIDDSALSAMQFFAQVNAGTLVKARGLETSATALTATEVELELEQ